MGISEALETRKSQFFLALFYAIALVTYWLRPFGATNEVAQAIIYVAAPLFAVLAGLGWLAVYGMTQRKSVLYFSLLVGLSFLLAGEVIFVFYDVFLMEQPFPTIADALYLLSYPFLFISILLEIRLMGARVRGVNASILALFVLIFAVLATVEGYVGVYLAFDPSEPFLNNLISIAYGAADIFLIAGALAIFFFARHLRRTSETYFWTTIAAGFSSITAADILFANFNELYLAGNTLAVNVMDSLWILGYTVIAFALASLAEKNKENLT